MRFFRALGAALRAMRLPPEEKARLRDELRRDIDGISADMPARQMICPHCQQRGLVRTRQLRRKVGVSGGKATAALITAGLSLFLVGLSREENVTEAHCKNCYSTWHF